MSSAAPAAAEMECGTSLAEDAWAAAPPAAAAAATTKGGDASSASASTSVEEAWAKIRRLRARLAADVVCDPPSSNTSCGIDGGSADCNFPTFVSPYEHPAKPASAGQPRKGMAIPLVYCDQTASQRPVQSIEEYLRRTSMPCHANTHTNTTYTGSQSTAFAAEARQIVGECTNARITGKAALDTVLFGGNGVTGAVAILVDCLNLRGVAEAASHEKKDMRPVVFVGPHEHHSNLLPWRESGCEVVSIPERASDGMVDVDELERRLHLPRYSASSERLRMGAFSAVSNVTGLIADVDRIAITLHRHGALAFFDYASGAPYAKMDMNPSPVQFEEAAKEGEIVDPSKDAIYFSPHKCYGGTSTPGVLVIKKRLVSQTNPPSVAGGGTVFYVTNQDHRFLSNRVERYEGGTPDGIGVQRVGLALLAGRRIACEYERLARSATTEGAEERRPPPTLLEYECATHDRVVARLKNDAPNLIVLGAADDGETTEVAPLSACAGRHLPVFSFLIRCGRRFLHYNYVCAVLNDLFGIQSRGGCQCAGPYSQRLLGLTAIAKSGEEVPNEANRQIERALLRADRPCELLRPGYTRLSFPFKGLREEEAEYVTDALIWVAKNGWALLPQYRCDHKTGEWRHWSRQGKPLGKSERRWLSHYDILAPTDAPMEAANAGCSFLDDAAGYAESAKASRRRLDQAMENANAILESSKHDPRFLAEVEKMNSADGMLGSGGNTDAGEGGIDNTLEDLRWFAYPQEVAHHLREGRDVVPRTFEDDSLLGGLFVRMDGKRRPNDAMGNRAVIEPSTDDALTTDTHMKESSAVAESGIVAFRDGDHMGEAPFEEVKAGYEDGELSEACELYAKDKDDWVSISDFIEGGGSPEEDRAVAANGSASCRKRDLSVMEEDSPSYERGINSMKIDSCPSDAMDASATPITTQTNGTLPPAVEKREKKKPSRDCSQWGQCSAPHIAPSNALAAATVSIEGSGNAGEKNSTPDTIDTPNASAEAPMSNKKKRNKGKIKPPPKMMRFITQAMIQWEMIQEGDRLLLGLSGGKDSLSLLHCLLEFQRKLPIKFTIEVCTIDPMTPSFDPTPLIPYVEGLGLKYHYIRDDIVERAASSGKDGKTVSSLCAFCARMKRGNLYSCARKNNCNKLVLAQHLDDCAESFLMSCFHNGFVRTMKAHYQINAGDISVIRPLVYCRENLMTEFAKSANLPVINENCPACFEEPKERARVKKLLSREETLYPNLYDNVRRALIPVMHDDSTSIMRSYLEETIAKSRKVPGKPKKAKGTNGGTNSVNGGAEKCKKAFPTNSDALSKNASSLESATEEELVAELARRRAAKYKLSGAMKRLPNGDEATDDTLPEDATGQVCTIDGRDGTIRCTELME